MPDLSRLEPEMQMRMVEYLRQQAQDQQDVQNAQFAVEQATKRGVFGDFDTMDGLSRAATMATLAKSGPAGARQVMAVIARREQEMEAERRAQEQQDRLDERAMETQRHEDYRAELGRYGQTERAQVAADAKVDPVAQRRAHAPQVYQSIMDQTNGRANPRVVQGLVEQWVATGKMEDRPTVSPTGETKQADPFSTPKYKGLRAKFETAAKNYQAQLSAETKAALDKATADLNDFIDKAGTGDSGSGPSTGDPIDSLIDSMSPEELKAYLAGER